MTAAPGFCCYLLKSICRTSRLRNPGIVLPILLGMLVQMNCTVAQTVDLILTRRDSSDETVKRRGTITEWRGSELTLDSDGRERKIANAEIVEIQTTWPAEYSQALASLELGDWESANKQLQAALALETRLWARRAIRADWVRVLSAMEQHDTAIRQFLIIVREDPQTRHFYLCPLQWIATSQIPQSESQALVDATNPVERLVGASWLLVGSDREKAIKVLETLASDIDPRIQCLAIAQLWRLRLLNLGSLNARQVEVWETRIAEMPPNLRAGPWYLVAEAQSRTGKTDDAAVNWLRIPILYPEQLSLSAAALYQTRLLLHNASRADEARAVVDELKLKYPQSVWASQR